jgi:hypothetical protein
VSHHTSFCSHSCGLRGVWNGARGSCAAAAGGRCHREPGPPKFRHWRHLSRAARPHAAGRDLCALSQVCRWDHALSTESPACFSAAVARSLLPPPPQHSSTQPPLPCLQSEGSRTRSRRRSRSRQGPQRQHHTAISRVRRPWLEPAPECSPFCQRPLTRLHSHLFRSTPWSQSGVQRHRRRERLRARCRPQGDADHQPVVRRRPSVRFPVNAR